MHATLLIIIQCISILAAGLSVASAFWGENITGLFFCTANSTPVFVHQKTTKMWCALRTVKKLNFFLFWMVLGINKIQTLSNSKLCTVKKKILTNTSFGDGASSKLARSYPTNCRARLNIVRYIFSLNLENEKKISHIFLWVLKSMKIYHCVVKCWHKSEQVDFFQSWKVLRYSHNEGL